ncbi:MAG: LexA family transcriptional regulator [Candidatus Pacebacteria bacterium]|nr:LexA family transcriptional regulator [Candidatus Paceibacterota bacterium]
MDQYKELLQTFYRNHKRMPGYSEMCTLFGFASKNAVAKVVDKLVEAGIVRKDAQGKLTPIVLGDEVPLVGYVEAGFPSPAEEQALDRVTMEELLLGEHEKMYLLRVKGLSMVDAGIHEGDLLLVEKTNNARLGDIVVANLDGEWTVKYLREKRGRKYLEPANEDYHDLWPEQSLEIGGVVRSVIRTYQR